VQPAIAEILDARLNAANRGAEPSGRLIVGASILFAPMFVVPAVAAFMQEYPNIEVELKLSDRFVDLVEERMDLAIRIGDMPSSSELTARQLGGLRRVVFGAPAYFDRHGRPRHPDELKAHQCVLRSAAGDSDQWPFQVNGKARHVKVKGRFRADHIAAVNAAAVQGLGIAFAPLWQISDLVKRGDVELILTEFEAGKVPVRAVWPTTKLPLPKKTRLFIDFLASRGIFADT
jgi:DNA-binding transcriptional LysR family regulator